MVEEKRKKDIAIRRLTDMCLVVVVVVVVLVIERRMTWMKVGHGGNGEAAEVPVVIMIWGTEEGVGAGKERRRGGDSIDRFPLGETLFRIRHKFVASPLLSGIFQKYIICIHRYICQHNLLTPAVKVVHASTARRASFPPSDISLTLLFIDVPERELSYSGTPPRNSDGITKKSIK